jgi:hypothetical protein
LLQAEIPDDFRFSMTNAPGKDAYPIAGATWLLVYQQQKDPNKGKKACRILKVGTYEGGRPWQGSRLRTVTRQCSAARPETDRRNQIVNHRTEIEMFSRPRVLFICVHNSAQPDVRSFCEALRRRPFRRAKCRPGAGQLNPLVVEAMARSGSIFRKQNQERF